MTTAAKLRFDAKAIWQAALVASHAGEAVRRHFVPQTESAKRTHLLAVGKAAYSMAEAVAERQPNLSSVLVVSKKGHCRPPSSGWQVMEAGHPIPDDTSLAAAQAVQTLARGLTAKDTLIVAVSGGASALLSAPALPLTLKDKQQTTKILLHAGANIQELNTVRKHLSFLKGGGLAALAFPARLVGLLLSDTIGDEPAVIGSGLTAPDPTSYADAVAVLQRFDVLNQVPPAVLSYLQEGLEKKQRETPKPGLNVFKNVTNLIVGSNALALQAAAEKGRMLGYDVVVNPETSQGEARQVAERQVADLKQLWERKRDKGGGRPLCMLAGGETTVTVRGNGLGGRNQELALAAALKLSGPGPEVVVLSAGTDGTDGPTDAAGAIATNDTIQRAQANGLQPEDFLLRNDSYHFFEPLGDLIKTGPTDTNVMDVQIWLADAQRM